MAGSKQISKQDVEKAGAILTNALTYFNKNAAALTMDSKAFNKWDSIIKELSSDLYEKRVAEGKGVTAAFVDTVAIFEQVDDEKKAEYVSKHPEIFSELPKLYGEFAASEETKLENVVVPPIGDDTQELLDQKTDFSNPDAEVAGVAAGVAALEADEASATQNANVEQEPSAFDDFVNDENSAVGSEPKIEEPNAEGPNAEEPIIEEPNTDAPKKQKKTGRFKTFIVGSLIAAVIAIGGSIGVNQCGDSSGSSDSTSVSPKIEKVSSAPSATMTLDSNFKYGDFKLIKTTKAAGVAVATDSLQTQNGGASVVDVAKKIENAKTIKSQSKNVAKDVLFTIENGTYLFDMTNPTNAKLANKYGLSIFQKLAMQDAGSFNGFDSNFMDLLNQTCENNLSSSLKDCDVWNVRDLNVKNTVVISLDGAIQTQEVKTPNAKTTTPATGEVIEQTTQASQELTCDTMLDMLGVDGCEQCNVFLGDDGYYHIEFNMVDFPHYLDDSTFVSNLKNCDLTVDMPVFDGVQEGPSTGTYVPDSTVVTPEILTPSTDSTTVIEKQIEDKTKDAAPIYQKKTDDDKDSSTGILNRAVRHKR